MAVETGDDLRLYGPLASFVENPLDISFETQERGEKIILMLRAHVATLLPALLQASLMLILPIAVSPLLGLLRINLLGSLAPRQIFWLWTFWLLLIFGFLFYKFVFWYFNVYFVTSERIIDFDFKGILNKQISFAMLSHIEDVNPKTVGFWGTTFNFGRVYIQTAAEKPEFEFENVPKPDVVAQRILEQVRRAEKEKPGEVTQNAG